MRVNFKTFLKQKLSLRYVTSRVRQLKCFKMDAVAASSIVTPSAQNGLEIVKNSKAVVTILIFDTC